MNLQKLIPENKQFRRIAKPVGLVLAVLLFFLFLLVPLAVSWMFRTWNGLTINELVFHLNSPLEGTDSGIIAGFILQCILVDVIVTAAVIVLYFRLPKRKWIVVSAGLAASFLAALISVIYMWNRLGISRYQDNQNTYSTFIDENYVDPRSVKLTFPEKKRNIIYIYLESMEMTYSDEEHGGAFEENVIPELTKISLENENFSGDRNTLDGGVPVTATTWTAAAMFGQTAGLPLLMPIESEDMNSSHKEFFPGVTTLGDILKEEGYRQYILMGSDAGFAGKGLYYTQHGGFTLLDYYYCVNAGYIPEGYKVFWGFEDDRLFEIAKDQLTKISSESEEPFNFTMLTVDTHFEDGYRCDDCPDTFGDNRYANVMACSSKKVSEFLDWVKQQDFYENTTVVIAGDHLTMDSDFCKDVPKDYERKVYTAYINSTEKYTNSLAREYTTLDMFPTTLASLGVKIQGNRLGLGANLYSSEATLLEKYDLETIDQELDKKSKLIDDLTEGLVDYGETEEGYEIKGTVTIQPVDTAKKSYQIIISDLQPAENVFNVQCAIWSQEDQSDIKWFGAVKQADGSYRIIVKASDFNSVSGMYKHHVYVMDQERVSYMISGQNAEIIWN